MNLKCRHEVVLLGNEISFKEAIIDEREPGTRDIDVKIGQSNDLFKDLAVEQGVVIGKTLYSIYDNFLLFLQHNWKSTEVSAFISR